MIKVYGIKNCDTVKKCLKRLEEKGLDYQFIDFKKTPPSVELLITWRKHFGEFPINKQGTTYRKLGSAVEEAAISPQGEALLGLLQRETSLIKRPILHWPDGRITFSLEE